MSIAITVFGNKRNNLSTQVDDGCTIRKAIETVGETVERDQQVRVNGALAENLDAALPPTAASITISGKAKGNLLSRLIAWLKAPLV